MRGAKAHAIRRLLVSTVFPGALAVLVLGITGCDDRLARMEENQIRLQAMVAANARQLGDISSQVYVNNNEVQAGIQNLDRNDSDLAAGISSVQNKQDALHETVTAASQTLDRRMATLDENQRHLQDGVAEVTSVTRKTATDVTAIAGEQTAIHQTVQNSRKELGDSITTVAVNQEETRTDIRQLQQTDQRLVEQLVTLAVSQDRIHTGLGEIDKLMQTVAGDVTAVSRGQAALHQTLNEHSAAFASETAVLEQNQRTMQVSVDGIAGQTNRNVEGIAAIAAQQNTLQQTLGANHKVVTGQVAAAIENQQTLGADIRGLSDRTGQAASQLAALATGQDAIRETLKNDNETVAAKLTGLSEDQTGLKGELTGLHQKTDTVVRGVQSVHTEQAALRESLKADHQDAKDAIAQLTGGQRQVQDQLDILTSTAGQTTLDIMALMDSNAALRQVIRSDTAGVKERTDRIAAGLSGVAERQTAITENQQGLQGDIDTIMATAGQTALDVISLASGQDALQQTVQDRDKALNRQMASLAAGQDQAQSALDTVTATAGQTALDVIALNDGQARIAQSAQVDRQQLIARLTGIAQSQQQWALQLDAAQANVQTVAANIASLEQHIARLQGALQPSLDGLTTQLGTSGQSRAQFEAKVNQDIQAMADAIAELRQDQVSLVDEMQQIQKRTQSQTKDILTAIQQLRQPPVEVKVSDSNTSLESSVAEAVAK